MKKKLTVIILCLMLSGCTIHYQNQKGIRVKGKNFETKAGTIEKGKAHFWSELNIWIPWKPKG